MQMAEALKNAGLISENEYEKVVKEKTKKMVKEQHGNVEKKREKEVEVEDFDEEES